MGAWTAAREALLLLPPLFFAPEAERLPPLLLLDEVFFCVVAMDSPSLSKTFRHQPVKGLPVFQEAAADGLYKSIRQHEAPEVLPRKELPVHPHPHQEADGQLPEGEDGHEAVI